MRRLWHGRFWNRRWHASTGSIRRRRRKGLMSSKSFQYVRPDTVDEVVALLGAHGPAARLLAGGTDLLVRFRLGHVRPAIVIDLKRADGLGDRITEADSSLIRSEEHTSELQSQSNLVCRLLLEKKKKKNQQHISVLTECQD